MDKLQREWKENKIVTIPNFLKKEEAEKLHKFLLDLKEEDWFVSLNPFEKGNYFSNSLENKNIIEEGVKAVNQICDKGFFAYYFLRTDNHDFEKIIRSHLKTINEITGCNVKDFISIFASCYLKDTFLSTHTDEGRGKIAFVYNLTKNWKEEYGGNFELLGDDWRTIRKRVPPSFNSLTLFYVEGKGVPHRVTKVLEDKKRIAFTGWLI